MPPASDIRSARERRGRFGIAAIHDIETAYEHGWSTFENGALTAQAEAAGFDVLLTTDRQLRYQQNLSRRRVAIVVLSTTQCRTLDRRFA